MDTFVLSRYNRFDKNFVELKYTRLYLVIIGHN